MRVTFLHPNKTHRGDFKVGDSTDVNERRARIWAEAGMVEVPGELGPKTARPDTKTVKTADKPAARQVPRR